MAGETFCFFFPPFQVTDYNQVDRVFQLKIGLWLVLVEILVLTRYFDGSIKTTSHVVKIFIVVLFVPPVSWFPSEYTFTS